MANANMPCNQSADVQTSVGTECTQYTNFLCNRIHLRPLICGNNEYSQQLLQPDPEIIKKSCSTQLSIKYFNAQEYKNVKKFSLLSGLLINIKKFSLMSGSLINIK